MNYDQLLALERCNELADKHVYDTPTVAWSILEWENLASILPRSIVADALGRCTREIARLRQSREAPPRLEALIMQHEALGRVYEKAPRDEIADT